MYGFWNNPRSRRRSAVDELLSQPVTKYPRLGEDFLRSGHTSLGLEIQPQTVDPPVKQKEPQLVPTIQRQQNDRLRRPISELPLRFRSIFEPYVTFNQVQSLVFESVMKTNNPLVVSAPTGSGKTGVFELAIIKMIMGIEQRTLEVGPAKVVYLAPTKALCSERRNDWAKKFKEFNIECIELTSDLMTPVNFKDLRKSSILLATPEKWDSVTRSWSGNKSFIRSIRLLLVDEVHLISDGHRGATLEAVISRMKIIRSIIWPNEPDSLRFIAVSATVSNVQDIADWLSGDTSKAEIFQVDPQERPVKLRTIVLGYACNPSTNDFQFDNLLNHKLAEVIKEYSDDKPTIVFCATRKSAVTAASTLCKGGKFDLSFSAERRKVYLKISAMVRDKTLQETTRFGVAFHHAGLGVSDRRLIEQNFLEGHLLVLCCTSTLAVGVNLPAHLVIIKNTFYYDEGRFKPYSESSLIQMMGRAGRPQFDTEATAVIMTKTFCRDEIEKMLTGKLIIDSHLHKFLTQHINSEIVLGTITNDLIARKWIDSTFLHVRLKKNPENYGLQPKSSAADIENSVIEWCNSAISMLLRYGMAKRDRQRQLEPTDAGRAMARHYICMETMMKLVQMKGDESIPDLLQVLVTTNEAISDTILRVEDRPALFKLNNPADAQHQIKYPIGDKIDSREKKALLLIQATFGNLTISENSLFHESIRVCRNANRVANCLRDMCLVDKNLGYQLIKNTLILSQCFAARLWEDSIYVSKQIEKIGPTLSNSLAHNGLTTFESLRKANPRNIEQFCNRLPPFGSKVQQTCFGLPKYELDIMFKEVPNQVSRVQIMVTLKLSNGQDMRNNLALVNHGVFLILGNIRDNKLLLITRVVDDAILNCADMTMCFGEEVDKLDLPDEDNDIEGYVISEAFVGLNVKKLVKFIEPESGDP